MTETVVWLLSYMSKYRNSSWKQPDGCSMHQDGVGVARNNNVGVPQSIRAIGGAVVPDVFKDKIVAVLAVSRSNIICHNL